MDSKTLNEYLIGALGTTEDAQRWVESVKDQTKIAHLETLIKRRTTKKWWLLPETVSLPPAKTPWSVSAKWQARSYHSHKDPAWANYVKVITGRDYGTGRVITKKPWTLRPLWMQPPPQSKKKGK